MLEIFALVVIIVLIVAVVVIAAMLGALPGRIARKREHPQAAAINVCGWLGLLTLGGAWIVAMVWAHARPLLAETGVSDTATGKRLASLEEEIRELRDALAHETR